ncbi:hypothetical protein SynROS8604_03518 [Synechococcus sp. ROS8604]|nr:hypothetical protein SynROS8604_03518 [Synechococcus sp. ROS8604]
MHSFDSASFLLDSRHEMCLPMDANFFRDVLGKALPMHAQVRLPLA